MLAIYDSGAQVPPNFSELSSRKANQTQAQGFWPTTSAAGVAVFGSSSTQDIQDVSVAAVTTTSIYACRRTGTTTIECRKYSTGGDSWAAMTNQPPTMTGKTIKAGGGVMTVTDGTNFWLFVIDSTDNAIKYVKATVATDTWDAAWTTLATVASTATKMSGYPILGSQRAGLVYSVTNGSNFDTVVVQLSLNTSTGVPARTLVGVGKLAQALVLAPIVAWIVLARRRRPAH
jgi:hypothetical protein